MHLEALYSLLAVPAPDYLQHPFTHALARDALSSDIAHGGVMRRAQ